MTRSKRDRAEFIFFSWNEQVSAGKNVLVRRRKEGPGKKGLMVL